MAVSALPPLPLPPEPQSKDRRGWLIAFGVIEILLAAVALLFAVFTALVLRPQGPTPAQPSGITTGSILFAVSIYLLVGGVLLLLGIGSCLARNWARIGMIVVSSFWLAFGLVASLLVLLVFPASLQMAQQQGRELPAGFALGFTVVFFLITSVFLVALPAIFLFFYTRKSVRETCMARSGYAPGASSRPVAVWLLLANYGVAFLAIPYLLFFGRNHLVFGVVLPRPATIAVHLVSLAVVALILLWLYQCRRRGWMLALGYQLFWLVSYCVTILMYPDMTQAYLEMGYSPAEVAGMGAGRVLLLTQLVMLIFAGAVTGLIAYAGRYFRDAPVALPAVPPEDPPAPGAGLPVY
jgi:hypothetical protein